MYEITSQLMIEAHRQNIEREFQHERNIREAQLARQDAKRERQYNGELEHKTVRKAR